MGFGKVDKNVDLEVGDILVYVWDGSSWTPQKANASGEVIIGGSLVKEDFDYVSVAYDTTTDTYTFKSGGSSGDTVATVTVTYTDSTKVDISSVAKT